MVKGSHKNSGRSTHKKKEPVVVTILDLITKIVIYIGAIGTGVDYLAKLIKALHKF
ncbi:hypothetical protein [Ligilactobacillus saerimneri]|uniref:hypothetical protein n=1 Tax=Ligilactobacillus saerimneri TaxID=228229 RepID=UPI0024BBD1A0|nr:hypothetical protein [Ligilactobacillus saerimneri]